MKQLPSTKPSCALKKVFHFSEKKISTNNKLVPQKRAHNYVMWCEKNYKLIHRNDQIL